MQRMATDTAVQKAVADEIGTEATNEHHTITAFLDEVNAMQGSFEGDTYNATAAKAAELNEKGVLLANQLQSISERVGTSAGGYISVDSDGASSVASSGATAF